MTWSWFVLALALVALAALYLSWTAGRVDRLHTRLEAARSALDAQLLRRGSVALETATSDVLDPATALLLADAVLQARAAGDAAGEAMAGAESGEGDGQWEVAESNLSRTLAAIFPDRATVAEIERRPGAAELLTALGSACRRADMARRFHNDTVQMARSLRSRWRVRWFRLAGNAAWPETTELDTAPPPGLS